MKFGNWGRVGLPLLFIAAGASGAAIVVACSSDSTPSHSTPDSGGGGGDRCQAPTAGTFPVATCAVSDDSVCPATADPGCVINAQCGDTTTCMPMASNTGKPQLDFRMRRINVQGPAALTSSFMQNVVVTKNVDLAPTANCGDNGFDAFNWLIRVDTTNNTLTTGGAPPTTDPFTAGYCFYNFLAPPENKIDVTPVTVPLVKNSDGSYSGQPAPLLNVPIFLNGAKDNVIILPISDATIHTFNVSNDGNCVGSFNKPALDTTCDESTTCEKWKTAGSLGGYITLEAADTVTVADLTESLCVVLTQTTKGPGGKCNRGADGKIPYQGDYCSTTKSAGGCADSFWMSATFAASAVKIDDSGTVAECKGGQVTPADAGSDSATDSGADTGPSPADAAAE